MNRLIVADIKSPVTEGICAGHFTSVARNYDDMFHNKIETIVAGGPIYYQYFSDNVLALPYNIKLQGESKIKSICKYFRNAEFLFRNSSNDIIIVQQGSDATFFAACAMLYKRKRNNRLYLIQYSKASLQGFVKRLLYRMARRKMDGIICPNEEVGASFGLPYCIVPDYIYIPSKDEEIIPYEAKQYDICFLGRIVEEKGIIQFLEHFAASPYKMIVAGRPANKDIADRLQSVVANHSNIQLNLSYQSQADYKFYLRNSRFCVLNYTGEYSKRSSGVVLDMIFHDVPVIGLDCTALDFIKQYKLGFVYGDLNSLNLDTIISPTVHRECVTNISNYKRLHADYRKHLFDFLMTNNK